MGRRDSGPSEFSASLFLKFHFLNKTRGAERRHIWPSQGPYMTWPEMSPNSSIVSPCNKLLYGHHDLFTSGGCRGVATSRVGCLAAYALISSDR